jgi:dihydroneopterin aldolase
LTPTVVKVGGSFARYKRLGELVAALERGAGRTIVVPGGGPFADLVRAEQRRTGADDRTAHRMALLAMASFGYALAGRAPLLVPASSQLAIAAALGRHAVPVWLPLDILDGRADIRENWAMTSDSLSIWLAAEVSAARLIFLKRGRLPQAPTATALSAAGLLDPLAPHRLAAAGIDAWLCGPRDIGRLGQALAAGAGVGRPIGLA